MEILFRGSHIGAVSFQVNIRIEAYLDFGKWYTIKTIFLPLLWFSKYLPSVCRDLRKEYMCLLMDPKSLLRGKEVRRQALLPNVKIRKPCHSGLWSVVALSKMQWQKRTLSFPQEKLATGEGGVRQRSELHTTAPSQGERAPMGLGSEDPQETQDFAHCNRELEISWWLKRHWRVLSKAMAWYFIRDFIPVINEDVLKRIKSRLWEVADVVQGRQIESEWTSERRKRFKS